MTSIMLTIYLAIGLIVAHFYLKKVNEKMNKETEEGGLSDKSKDVAERFDQMTRLIGEKQVIVMVYVGFSLTWAPALIYVYWIKK